MVRLVGFVVLAVLTTMPDAMAQYYYPAPVYPRPYYRRPVALGFHCRTRIATAYGVTPLVCPIANPKAVGLACACPPPGYGPFLRGRTVR